MIEYNNEGMQVIAVCNQKGGVGKTTTVFNLAIAYSQAGKSVLCIDLDEQENLTMALGINDKLSDLNVADFLMPHPPHQIEEALCDTYFENVYLIRSGKQSMNKILVEMTADGVFGSEYWLRNALTATVAPFDIVLIDCGPNINRITSNALVAANKVALVTQSAMFATSGLAKLAGIVESIQNTYNPDLNIAGIIINQYKANTNSSKEWLEIATDIAADFKTRILEPYIPESEPIKRTVLEHKALGQLSGVKNKQTLIDIYEKISGELLKEGE